uniref:Tail tape measure protein n=1 Tax=Myoviridae sp. ct25F5 TaxID=2826604 RepID=A0A8S5LT16_9CAUD|nr:MAG TPA: tail tape measure protein [Myoviridae sp. ct25F5]
MVWLSKQAIDSYGDYEQLVGGVDTLFKESSATVQGYAQNAYKTAGLSANEYMETVTSFSASLLQSLGNNTAAAAEMADLAITDMSDNANKMGTDMTAIQNAYNGFAKQNYTMLDNLKLGYGGTKEEMQRLIDDANALNTAQGRLTEYSIDSYADIVSAIHDVQTEMGITGTTSLEASTTIQGSLASMKSAWKNLLTGIADPDQDLGMLINNMVNSAGIALDNLVPLIVNLLPRIATALGTLGKKLTKELPGIIRTLLPALISGAIGLITGLVTEIPAILAALWDAVIATWSTLTAQFPILGNIESAAVSAMGKVRSALEPLKSVFQDAWQKIKGIWDTVEPYFAMTWESIKQVFSTAWDAIKAVWDVVGPYFEAIWEGIKSIFSAVPSWLPGIWETAWAAIKGVWNAVTGFFANIWNTIAGIFSVVEAVFKGDFEGAWEAIKGIVSGWANYFKSVWESIKEVFSAAVDVGTKIVNDIKEGISKAWDGIKAWFRGLWDSLFGNLTANVTVNKSASGGATDGSHARGLDFVPFDGYVAELHKGEMVVPAAEARAMRNGFSGFQDGEVANLLKQILYAVQDSNKQETVLKINNREFGRAVRGAVNA